MADQATQTRALCAKEQVLAVLDRQLRNQADRAHRSRLKADKAAAKLGEPQITAERRAEFEALLLAELKTVRDGVAAWPDPGLKESYDGYVGAFHEIADMLDIGARPESPKHVYETEIRPRLRALIGNQRACRA